MKARLAFYSVSKRLVNFLKCEAETVEVFKCKLKTFRLLQSARYEVETFRTSSTRHEIFQ